MTSTYSRLCSAGLAAALIVGTALSASADTTHSANIVKIQAGGGDMGGDAQQRRSERRGGAAFRDYRSDYRDDYRRDRDWRDRNWRRDRHDNDWQAPAALLGGLLLGGAIANSAQPQPYNPHVDWCTANTPGYNPYDNTYQAYYGGPRVICRSPYY
jgi:hypothetical protein